MNRKVLLRLGPAWGVALLLALPAYGRQTASVMEWGNQVMPAVSPGTSFTAIAAGDGFSLGLESEGAVVAWGDNSKGQCAVPAGLTHVVAIAAGWDHSLAIEADGQVVAWGGNSEGQSGVPPWLRDVTGIAAGDYHSLALQTNGTVIAWGAGAPNRQTAFDYGQSTVPVGLSGVLAIAAGGFHSLALVVNPVTPSFPPVLRVRRSSNQLIVSWPTYWPGFLLQATTNLLDPSSWRTLPLPAVKGSNYVWSFPAFGAPRFYRLRHE